MRDSILFQNPLGLPFTHLYSDCRKILVGRLNMLLRRVAACHEHDNLTVPGPRMIWLRENFCGPRVLGTDMRCELFVALLFVELLHLVN
jgi:hypothetical protein